MHGTVNNHNLKTSKRVLILQGLISEAQQALKGGDAIASVKSYKELHENTWIDQH